jgi:hypothetical protein
MTAPPRFNAGPETRGITITVNERVYAGLVDMARAASRTPNVQAQLLFEAAYSARCKPTGDRDLDAAVAAMDEPGPLGSPLPEGLRVTGIRHASLDEGGPRDPDNPAHHSLPMAVIAIASRVAAEAMGGGMAEDPRSVDELKQEETHVEGTPTPLPVDRATAGDPGSREVPDASEEGFPVAEELGDHPPHSAHGGERVVDPPAPSPSPAAPAAAPSEPLISAATLKYMRTLKSIDNSMDEIADMVGLPVKAVREALAVRR